MLLRSCFKLCVLCASTLHRPPVRHGRRQNNMTTLNIAHRGGAGLWPENTLAAFRNAIALGADGAELDVHLSKDGEVVLFHDYRLKPEIVRDAAGKYLVKPTPRIKDLTLAELRTYDIGRHDRATPY